MNDEPVFSADEALRRLVDGNERFVSGRATVTCPTRETLAKLSAGQRPYATILGCSDSRVPPEWVFDAGLGELFVVRVAGNVFSPEVAGSLQYAAAHLRTPLFVVLGHEGCGAVQAALETVRHGTRQRSRIQLLVDGIIPGLAEVDPEMPPALQLAQAVESNVRWTMRAILETPEGRERAAEGLLKLVGAVCEIRTGRVRLLDAPVTADAGAAP
ncbi:MAG: carbonic anhydrase [Phycisphaerae bacterium]|nr:carbonic anhydrase [Tepidisphaeraceae bacterium]